MEAIVKKSGIIALISVISFVLRAQDPQFSQFYNNTMYYNPATTGLTQDLRLSTSYRNQWNNIPGEFSTYFISLDYQLRSKNIGLGLLMFNDNEGLHNLRTQRFELFYSYRIQAKNKLLQLGATVFSLNVRDLNNDGFIFGDQLDPVHGVVQNSSFIYENVEPKVYPDWNLGIVYRQNFLRNREYFLTPTIGASVSHVFRPNISLLSDNERLEAKYVIHSSVLTRFVFNRDNPWKRKIGFLNPGFIYEYQNPFQTFTVGSGFDIYPLRFGMWFRNYSFTSRIYEYNTVIFLAGVVIPVALNHNLMIDYTYDSTISKLDFSTGGAHEIMIIYNLSLPEKKGEIPCFNEWWRLGRGITHYSKPE